MYLATENAETRANMGRLNRKRKVKEYHPACVHLCGYFQSDRVQTVRGGDKESQNVCAYRIWTLCATDSRGLVNAREVCAGFGLSSVQNERSVLLVLRKHSHNPTAQLQKAL